jgi:hypothetical protein
MRKLLSTSSSLKKFLWIFYVLIFKTKFCKLKVYIAWKFLKFSLWWCRSAKYKCQSSHANKLIISLCTLSTRTIQANKDCCLGVYIFSYWVQKFSQSGKYFATFLWKLVSPVHIKLYLVKIFGYDIYVCNSINILCEI